MHLPFLGVPRAHCSAAVTGAVRRAPPQPEHAVGEDRADSAAAPVAVTDMGAGAQARAALSEQIGQRLEVYAVRGC